MQMQLASQQATRMQFHNQTAQESTISSRTSISWRKKNSKPAKKNKRKSFSTLQIGTVKIKWMKSVRKNPWIRGSRDWMQNNLERERNRAPFIEFKPSAMEYATKRGNNDICIGFYLIFISITVCRKVLVYLFIYYYLLREREFENFRRMDFGVYPTRAQDSVLARSFMLWLSGPSFIVR